jgi:hypothetical protein
MATLHGPVDSDKSLNQTFNPQDQTTMNGQPPRTYTRIALAIVVAAVIVSATLYTALANSHTVTQIQTPTSTFIETITSTFTSSITGSQTGSGYELNCVVTFQGDNPVPNGTTLATSSFISLLKDYTTFTSVSSKAGVAVTTTTALTSAQGFPIWNETVCTWLP